MFMVSHHWLVVQSRSRLSQSLCNSLPILSFIPQQALDWLTSLQVTGHTTKLLLSKYPVFSFRLYGARRLETPSPGCSRSLWRVNLLGISVWSPLLWPAWRAWGMTQSDSQPQSEQMGQKGGFLGQKGAITITGLRHEGKCLPFQQWHTHDNDRWWWCVCSMPCNGSVYLKWYGISHCYEIVLVAKSAYEMCSESFFRICCHSLGSSLYIVLSLYRICCQNFIQCAIILQAGL